MNFNEYMNNNFPSLSLRPPLFYNWDYGLRFEIGNPNIEIYKDSNRNLKNHIYFEEALNRAKKIFEVVFEPNNKMFCIFHKYSRGKQKIKKNSYCYRNINFFDKVESFKTKDVFYQEDIDYKCEHHHRLIFHTTRKDINYVNILNRGIFRDFGGNSLETYFINIDKNIIFHLYDDRGLDIISKEQNTLKNIYQKYNHWILDYDREKIDNVFKNL